MNLSKLPIVRNWVKKINQKIEQNGLQSTAIEIIKKTNSKIEINGKEKRTWSVLKNKPVIIVANHPAEADVLVLLAGLENRIDNNLIINSTFTKLSANLDKHLIPVYINSRLMAHSGFDKLKLIIFKKFHKTEDKNQDEEHLENIKSINRAIEKLNQKQLVAIFPGGGGKNGKWFSGVGYMIKGVKKINQTYIVKAYIEGTSNWDGLRIFRIFSWFLPKFKISFSEPNKLSRFQLLGPRETANALEIEYNQWVESLNSKEPELGFLNRLVFSQRGYFIIRSLFIWLMANPK